MKKLLALLFVLFLYPSLFIAAETTASWQREIISLISHNRFNDAGMKIKEYCVEQKNGDLCLILASAYFEGEAKFGINSKEIIEAYKYTKLACDYGSESGCSAYKAAVEKGELVKYILFEPGVDNRDAKLKKAVELGMDLNATSLFSMTLLQEAISEEKTEAISLLLENGADVNYRVSNDDLTPLMYAINTGNELIVTQLLKNGADTKQTMNAPSYLKMGKKMVNACDFANKLESHKMLTLLKCIE